jgi:hypothetical protein
MDEARRVIMRLERIDSLRREDAPASTLLAEVRGLLDDGEAWLAAEGRATGHAGAALDRCRARLEEGEEAMSGAADSAL